MYAYAYILGWCYLYSPSLAEEGLALWGSGTGLVRFKHPISATRNDGECIILLMVQKSGEHQLRLVVFPIIYRVLYIPGGAGFLPSTVSNRSWHVLAMVQAQNTSPPLANEYFEDLRWQLVRVKFLVWGSVRPNTQLPQLFTRPLLSVNVTWRVNFGPGLNQKQLNYFC